MCVFLMLPALWKAVGFWTSKWLLLPAGLPCRRGVRGIERSFLHVSSQRRGSQMCGQVANLARRQGDQHQVNEYTSLTVQGTRIIWSQFTQRMRLARGKYCIIPCTFQPEQEGDFILRVHIERYTREAPGRYLYIQPYCLTLQVT